MTFTAPELVFTSSGGGGGGLQTVFLRDGVTGVLKPEFC